MESKRQRQVAELVKRNMGMLLQQEGTYIYGAEPLVTVTEVKMSPDLSLAKIYLSVYNVEDKQTVILEMEEQHSRIRQGLGHRLRKHVRRIPDIAMYLDDTLDEMYRLNQIFDNMHENDQMGEDSDQQQEEKDA